MLTLWEGLWDGSMTSAIGSGVGAVTSVLCTCPRWSGGIAGLLGRAACPWSAEGRECFCLFQGTLILFQQDLAPGCLRATLCVCVCLSVCLGSRVRRDTWIPLPGSAAEGPVWEACGPVGLW